MFYVCTDRQGTITALLKENGTVSERYSYDAWGRRRNPNNWADYNVPAPSLINRGYTGHEMLDGFGLINMNGRLYDPVIGRILSPDNYVQDPTNSQCYNRYSYCLNNPLRYTDPSGWLTALPEFVESGGMIYDFFGAANWHSNPTGAAGGGGGGYGYYFYPGGNIYAPTETEVQGPNGTVMVPSKDVTTYKPIIRKMYVQALDDSPIFLGYYIDGWEEVKIVNVVNSGGPNGYQLADKFGQLMNVGGIFYGGSEMTIQAIRRSNGAKEIGRAIGFGTQQTAKALKGTLGIVSKIGKGIGIAGYGIQFVSIGSKFVLGQEISTAEGVGFGISSVFVGAAWIAAGTLAAPYIAGAALIYGLGELGSYYLYNGKTLEENFIGK